MDLRVDFDRDNRTGFLGQKGGHATCARANLEHHVILVELRLGDEWRVNLDERLLASLREWLQPENVEVLYA